MNGDITRSTFDADKAYTSVRHQQGRVHLDADLNEQRDIELHDERGTRIDVIGPHGAPTAAPGLEVAVDGGGLTLSPGRYYIDGLRVVIDGSDPIPWEDQPWLPDAALPDAAASEDHGLYLAVLDVWERPITAIEDPAIREVALGGPDTTTRTQLVWQVRLLPVTTEDADPNCQSDFLAWTQLVDGSTGQLEVRLSAGAGDEDPCSIPEEAGYRGLENQCYRVQIHVGDADPTAPGGSDGTTPTFKWSRDNGAVIAAWTEHPDTLELVVDRLGPGGTFGFAIGDLVEITDDDDDLAVSPGVMATVADVQDTRIVLEDPDGTVAAALAGSFDADLHPKLRRWDSAAVRDTTVDAGELGGAEVTADGWIRLEHGIEVRFDGGTHRSGDYWLIPARTAALPGTDDRQLDWPVDGSGTYLPRPADGPVHHYARLALLELDAGGWAVLDDCRPLFSPLTDQVQLSARGGDGQEAPSGHWLPAPLVIGVGAGRHPIQGARLQVRLVPRPDGGPVGALSATEPDEDGTTAGSDPIEVLTDAQGIARAWWQLAPGPTHEEAGDRYQPARSQQVEVLLLDDGGSDEDLPLRFVATPVDERILVPVGGNGQRGWPGETLEIALRARVSEGSRAVVGAHVEWVIMDHLLDGDPLDQYRGGAVHASDTATRVSWEPWPGGSRMISAVVRTDAEGVSQIQWVLGTEQGLPVQRVMAYLLDDEGNRTSQQALFTATLNLAREVHYTPCDAMAPYLKGEQRNVQAALDLICNILQVLVVWVLYIIAWILQQDTRSRATIDKYATATPKDSVLSPRIDALIAAYRTPATGTTTGGTGSGGTSTGGAGAVTGLRPGVLTSAGISSVVANALAEAVQPADLSAVGLGVTTPGTPPVTRPGLATPVADVRRGNLEVVRRDGSVAAATAGSSAEAIAGVVLRGAGAREGDNLRAEVEVPIRVGRDDAIAGYQVIRLTGVTESVDAADGSKNLRWQPTDAARRLLAQNTDERSLDMRVLVDGADGSVKELGRINLARR